MFKVNGRKSGKRCQICSKSTIKTTEQRHWRHSDVFIVNYGHILHFFLVFLLLALARKICAGTIFDLSSSNDNIVFFVFFMAYFKCFIYFNIVSCCNLGNCMLLTLTVITFSTPNWLNTQFFLCSKKIRVVRTLPKIVNG